MLCHRLIIPFLQPDYSLYFGCVLWSVYIRVYIHITTLCLHWCVCCSLRNISLIQEKLLADSTTQTFDGILFIWVWSSFAYFTLRLAFVSFYKLLMILIQFYMSPVDTTSLSDRFIFLVPLCRGLNLMIKIQVIVENIWLSESNALL